MIDIDAIKWIALIIMGVIGYFFKDLHTRHKDLERKSDTQHESVIKLEGKVKRLDEKMPSEIANLKENLEMRFDAIEKTITHLNTNIQQSTKYFRLLLEKMNIKTND